MSSSLGEAGASERLRQRIADEIRRSGPIPFSRYMELCLYQPELGYYSSIRERFGKGGDFYTSSDVHAVFGRLLARQFDEMGQVLAKPSRIDLVELGPGRGLFARDVLDCSRKHFPGFYAALQYSLVEQSSALRTRLRETLAEHCHAGKVTICESLEEAAAHASDNLILFGNEFFDALPVEIVDYRGAVRVGIENDRFAESFATVSPAENDFLDRYGVHPQENERVEVCLPALTWTDRIAKVMQGRHGFVVLIDYGYTREEQLAGRHRDTLMTYRQHVASPSPYLAPGEQDITAHVNFTALRARVREGGLRDLGLLTQSQFLLGIGEETQFADAFQDCVLPQERAKVALQLKHLISPSGMGETFQVLLLGSGVEAGELRLSGLKLAR